MKICHVCKKECEDSLDFCPVCGADLTNAPITEEAPTENDNIIHNPTQLYSFEDIVAAEIFKDILKKNNILFTASSDMGEATLQVTFGGVLVSEDIYVDENDFETASSLLEDFLSSDIEFDGEFFEGEEEE